MSYESSFLTICSTIDFFTSVGVITVPRSRIYPGLEDVWLIGFMLISLLRGHFGESSVNFPIVQEPFLGESGLA